MTLIEQLSVIEGNRYEVVDFENDNNILFDNYSSVFETSLCDVGLHTVTYSGLDVIKVDCCYNSCGGFSYFKIYVSIPSEFIALDLVKGEESYFSTLDINIDLEK